MHTTLTGYPVAALRRALPRATRSLCPACLQVIPATLRAEDGRVVMQKTCPEHGSYRELVFFDVELFLRLEDWHFGDGEGFANPATDGEGACPERCGICGWHSTHTSLANVDLTGRCNLACPTCFANSNGHGDELSYEQAVEALRRLRAQRPAPAFAVQFTGGEPTIHPRFLEIVAAARALGFTHIQVATNGLALAEPDFARRARDAGLQYLYLQMDGTTDAVFQRLRGRPLLETKLATLAAARAAGLRVIFVPTIARGVNDDQLGPLFRLAFEHLDVLSGISFQPITFTGRVAEHERLARRYTLGDLAHDFAAQTGLTRPDRDWLPLSAAVPLIRYAGALSGTPLVNHTCHPHCGVMALLFVDEQRRAVPVTQFLEVHPLLADLNAMAARTERSRVKVLSKVRALQALHRYFDPAHAPSGLTFFRFLKTLDGFADKKYSWDPRYRGYTYKTFYLAGMHFMDAYNYDLERVCRCGVHYAAPDGRLYPFCTYNSGPTFRDRVERGLRCE